MIIFKTDKVQIFCRKNDYLEIRFTHKGKRHRKSCGKNSKENKKRVIAIAKRINSDILWEKFEKVENYFSQGGKNDTKYFLKTFQDFLDYRKKSGLKIKTLEHDQFILQNLKKIKTLNELDEKEIFLELKKITSEEIEIDL